VVVWFDQGSGCSWVLSAYMPYICAVFLGGLRPPHCDVELRRPRTAPTPPCAFRFSERSPES